MPDKSIKEMTPLERRHYSLSVRVFHATIKASIILGIAALLVGLGLYTYALINQYKGDAFDITKSAGLILDNVTGADRFSEAVMSVYYGMSEEDRQQMGTDAYHDRFSEFEDDSNYKMILAILNDFRLSSDINDIYLAMYVRDPSRLVYIADPDDKPGFVRRIGDWDNVEDREAETFLNLKWGRDGRLYDISLTKDYGWMCTAGVPVRDDTGVIVGYVLADITLTQVGEGMKTFLFQYSVTMLLVVNLIGFFMTRRMRKTLVAPINEIADAAQDYVRDRQAGIPGVDHFSMLNIKTGDELENLSLVMADMERDIADYEENLTNAVAEKERISTELDLARRIQADMLPNIFPPFPERSDLDIFASMTPAKEVGGDFYDFFLIDDSHLGLVIADVSGKGIPAALFMMIAKILVQNYSLAGQSPKDVLAILNSQICKNNREEMFVTVWLGILDLATGKLTAANAGHEYPILRQPDGQFEVIRDEHSFVIGGIEGIEYHNYELQLKPGAKLFVYTDGIPEATAENDELFGVQRTVAAINEVADQSPRCILEHLHQAVNRFVGTAPQFDDMTMLCVEYMPSAGRSKSVLKEWTLDAKVENIPLMTDQINEELEALDCPMKAQLQIDVAIDEIMSNISYYAYSPDIGKLTVRLETEDSPRALILHFIDHGRPFNPLSAGEPDTTLAATEREVGGLGIFLVKKSMDGMSYDYRDGQNILSIRKLL